VVGFGYSVPGVPLLAGVINLNSVNGTLSNMAFTAPRTGIITDFIATFVNTLTFTVINGGDLLAQIYEAPINSNLFTLLPAVVGVFSFTPAQVVAQGEIFTNGVSGLNIPVTAGNRYILAVTGMLSSEPVVIQTIVGYISAGLNIR
jgi:BclB C-terminal domain-containing protein